MAVKVQRPGIRKIVEVDLEIMLHLATLIERHIEEMALHRPVKIVEEFARTIWNGKPTMTSEASSMDRFSEIFLDDPTIYVPKVYSDMSLGAGADHGVCGRNQGQRDRPAGSRPGWTESGSPPAGRIWYCGRFWSTAFSMPIRILETSSFFPAMSSVCSISA